MLLKDSVAGNVTSVSTNPTSIHLKPIWIRIAFYMQIENLLLFKIRDSTFIRDNERAWLGWVPAYTLRGSNVCYILMAWSIEHEVSLHYRYLEGYHMETGLKLPVLRLSIKNRSHTCHRPRYTDVKHCSLWPGMGTVFTYTHYLPPCSV